MFLTGHFNSATREIKMGRILIAGAIFISVISLVSAEGKRHTVIISEQGGRIKGSVALVGGGGEVGRHVHELY